MDTYHRGQWGKDDTYSDNLEWDSKNNLVYEGYTSDLSCRLGDEYGWSMEAYKAKQGNAKYEFVAILGPSESLHCCLVTDFPSLIMLAKEILPFVINDREQELFHMREEEHTWKAKELEPYQYRKHCGHC